jgi:hypothetical protein
LSTQQTLPALTFWIGRYLQPILTIGGYMVPDWVGKIWLGTFGEEPILFLIGLLGLAVTMLIGLSQEESIRSRAGEVWHHRWQSVPKWAEDPKSTWLYKLRSNEKVIKAYRYFAWRVLPTLFLILCVGVYIWLLFQSRYSSYVIGYSILFLLALGMRNWIFRAQYTAKQQTPRSASGPNPPA